jgi:hypothetical protein
MSGAKGAHHCITLPAEVDEQEDTKLNTLIHILHTASEDLVMNLICSGS